LGKGLALRVARRLAAAATALALLVGCGNDGGSTNPLANAVGQMAKASLAKGKGGKAAPSAAPAPVSRAELAAFGKPILRVRAERLGQDGFLTIADTKGGVVTWTAQGVATFSLRDGVLIQTRGLGPDLMSAEAPSLGQLTSGASYPRAYFFLGEDDRGTRRSYDCVASTVGRETIEIVGKSHKVAHVTETCSRPNSTVTNEFWIEGTVIRKSRQWASSRISYVEFEKVID
jgi:Group 4 capsule polysaccharide lipoprotein gfcB, YjbF